MSETKMGNAVRSRREARGLSQGELAALAGVSINTVWAIENGKGCHVRTLQRLAECLKCSVADLTDGNRESAQ